MSKQVHICSPEDTIETAEQIMATHKAHRLAVADAGGRLRGILSGRPLLRARIIPKDQGDPRGGEYRGSREKPMAEKQATR